MADANIAVSDLNNYLPAFHQGIDLERGELIERYFKLGLKYKEICLFLLSLHGIEISVRHLKRILRQRQLARRNQISPNDVYEALLRRLRAAEVLLVID
jgi:predicted AAA+ superfamily ATPase